MQDNFEPGDAQAVVRYGDREFRFTHTDATDHIFSILKSSGGFYEIELLEKLAALLSPDDLVVDVGANIGTHSVFWSGVCGTRVVAFEPDAGNVAILRRNVQLNGLDKNVRVEQVALGSRPGSAKTVHGAEHNRGMTTCVDDENGAVKVRRLDDIRFEGPIRLLKIDVEGMEQQVLEGAAKTLKRDHPVIAVEASDRAKFISVANLLSPLGYKVVGTFNWTPTHLFVPSSEPSFKTADGALTESFALARFDWTTLRDGVMSRLASLDKKLTDQLQQLKTSAPASAQAASATKQLSELAGEQSEQSRKFEELRNQFVTLSGHISAGMSALEARFQTLTHLQDALASSQMKFAALEKELAMTAAQGGEAKAARDAASARAAALDRELAVSIAEGSHAKASAETAAARATALEKELAVRIAHGSRAEAAAESATVKVTALERELAVSIAQASHAQAAALAAGARVAVLEDTVAVSIAQGSQAKAAAESAGARIAALENELAVRIDQTAQARAAADAASSRAAAFEGQLAASVARFNEVKAAADNAATRVATLEIELASSVAHESETGAAAEAAGARVTALEEELSRSIERGKEANARVVALEENLTAATLQLNDVKNALASREAEIERERARAREATNHLINRDNRGKELSRQIERLEEQKRETEGVSRTQTSHLRKRLRAAHGRAAKLSVQLQQRLHESQMLEAELGRARALLQEFAGGVEAIAASRRWKVGDAFGRLTDKLMLRSKPPLVMDHMHDVLARFRAAEANNSELARSPSDDHRTCPEAAASHHARRIEPTQQLEKVPQANALVELKTAQRTEPVAKIERPTQAQQPVTAEDRGVSTKSTASRLVASFDYEVAWTDQGFAKGPCDLLPNGEVAAREKIDAFGFVSPSVAFEGGGLVEIAVELDDNACGRRAFLRIRSDDDSPIGPDVPLSQPLTSVRAFAPARTRSLKFYVLAPASMAGDSFRVRSVEIALGDADDHAATVRRAVGEPVIASLASIPSRQTMLRDCVSSLLVQCERVRVFLNGYSDVPDFLVHRRIEVSRSQDWDDRGDAGKMFWVDKEQGESGYRLVVDDDLVFPPDFAQVMCRKVGAHGNRAIFATHAVLLRQPLVRYYDATSRAATFHFRHAVIADRSVHIGATNALCYHTSAVKMTWSDFRYRNSADIWLATYAHKVGLPILTPARPANWVREGHGQNANETIYSHSVSGTRSRFDSSLVQDAVLRQSGPLTIHVNDRPKWGVGFVTEDAEVLSEALESLPTDATAEWVVMLIFNRGAEELAAGIAKISVKHETHLIDSRGDVLGGLRDTCALAETIKVDRLYLLSEHVRFARDAGNVGVVSAAGSDNDVSLLLRETDKTPCGALVRKSDRYPKVPDAVMSVTPDVAIDQRIQRGFNASDTIAGTFTVPASPASAPATVNTVFDRVLTMNLDRRTDRWLQASRRLKRAGISAERFRVVDDCDPTLIAEYQAYAETPARPAPRHLPRIRSSADFFHRYSSQAQRVAFLEAHGKAIRSPEAWGYLKSYEAILERAIADRVRALLVLEDGVLFHKDLPELFARAMEQVPDDWLVLQLGTLQYKWSSADVLSRSPTIYRANGAAVGSHAVGMRFEILPFILEHVQRMEMPFDLGALAAATTAFSDRCFVIRPNLVIPSLVDSEANVSGFLQGQGMRRAMSTYGWTIDDYENTDDAHVSTGFTPEIVGT